MTSIIQELQRRFDAINFNPRTFEFWLTIYDYINFVKRTAEIKAIIDEDNKYYSDAYDVIRKAWEHHEALYKVNGYIGSKSDKKIYDKIAHIHASELNKMDCVSVSRYFYDFEGLMFAIHEFEIKHELYTRGFDERHEAEPESRHEHLEWLYWLATDGAMKWEKELDEIRRGNIAKNNVLIKDAPMYYDSVRFIHRVLLNKLNEAAIAVETAARRAALIQDSDVVPLASPPTVRLSFNADSSILIVNDVKVKINRRRDDNNQHKLLNHIFKNPGQEHFYSEIAEVEFGNGDEYRARGESLWRTYYRACQTINARLSQDANAPDFLDFNTGRTGRVRINPKYLEK